MKTIRISLLMAMAMTLLAGTTYNAFACWCGPGTGTPGCWINHHEAWPVTQISIGGETYTIEEAIALMALPVKGDESSVNRSG